MTVRLLLKLFGYTLPVKPVQPAIDYMPNAAYELPYEGAKAMLLVSEMDDKAFLTGLFEAMYDELPQAKPKNVNRHVKLHQEIGEWAPK
ncbi:MAG: hypothetical protein Q4D78_06260, partial [Neisseria zoodegmatis]|nr:hypothetical protein [Neisseria zoodegmatis]